MGLPLAAIPTALSIFIGRGKNWARIVTVALFMVVGATCGCFGAFVPFLDSGENSRPASAIATIGLGLFTVLTSALLILTAVLLVLPQSNAFFREHKVAKASKS